MDLKVSQALELFDNYLRNQQEFRDPQVLYEPRNYVMNMPGKKMRALLTLLGSSVVGGKMEDALPAAYCVELFHNFTLVHDDIMDNAPIRRGMPAVHEKYSTNEAILTGDVMLIEVYDRLSQLDINGRIDAIKSFNTTAREVCEGQALDMTFEKRTMVSIEEYLNMIELKTAVLLGQALKLGAMMGGASASDQYHLYHFAKNAGVSFQIQDDYLDIYGEASKVGKVVGGDIIQCKKNYFYVKACELLEGENLRSFIRYYHDLTVDPKAKVKDVTAVYDELHLVNYCNEAKNSFFDLAQSHLSEVKAVKELKEHLLQFSLNLMNRDS